MELFQLYTPHKIKFPFLLNFPHTGTYIPPHISKNIRNESLISMDDTDWDLDRLYEFAFELGFPILKANYHRWVVDLNRDPSGKSLYNDGRTITGLVSTTDFLGNPIYSEGKEPTAVEIEARKQDYFYPYHDKIAELTGKIKKEFGYVFLWDAHSIRRNVPSIRKENFPDMILGTNSGQSCLPAEEELIYQTLSSEGFKCERNTIFKGGFITRSFGNPQQNEFSFQLEMSKDLYMKENETKYDSYKAEKLKNTLHSTIEKLNQQLLQLINKI